MKTETFKIFIGGGKHSVQAIYQEQFRYCLLTSNIPFVEHVTYKDFHKMVKYEFSLNVEMYVPALSYIDITKKDNINDGSNKIEVVMMCESEETADRIWLFNSLSFNNLDQTKDDLLQVNIDSSDSRNVVINYNDNSDLAPFLMIIPLLTLNK